MIQIEKMNKVFHLKSGDVTALDNVTLNIGDGMIYGVIGYSGAGKSTMLRCLIDLEKADGIAAEDPEVLRRQKQEKTTRLTHRIVAAAVAAAVVLAAVLYYVFFGGYKLAVYRYVKGVDRESGSMYVALVPDAYMDYLETTYSTTRREVKSMMQDYFKYWNKNYGTDGRMSYDIGKTEEITDADEISALESELKTDYNITVEIKKAVTVSVNIDDGGTKASEQATFVKIGNRWCCMKAMEDIDFVCQNDGYNVW